MGYDRKAPSLDRVKTADKDAPSNYTTEMMPGLPSIHRIEKSSRIIVGDDDLLTTHKKTRVIVDQTTSPVWLEFYKIEACIASFQDRNSQS